MPEDQKPIQVTKAFLPPLEEYIEHLKGVWDRVWLTNTGPLVQSLEKSISEKIGHPAIKFVTNGTIAMQIGVKALAWTGEVITTPFSYVATTSSLVWENCTPIFVDIERDALTIDAHKIEAAITEKTTGILATHVFGNPCDVEEIERIAKKHNLTVMYDGAHCFGVRYKGKSIFHWGDLSTVSFHATKLFHTVEGGAIFSNKPELFATVSYMMNFGHKNAEEFLGLGINGKNSEFHAAMGLTNLTHLESIMQKRGQVCNAYDDELYDVKGVRYLKFRKGSERNYAYYPLIFENEKNLLAVKIALEEQKIFARRYFYPALNELPYVASQHQPIASETARCILCLPLSHELELESVSRIAQIMKVALKS